MARGPAIHEMSWAGSWDSKLHRRFAGSIDAEETAVRHSRGSTWMVWLGALAFVISVTPSDAQWTTQHVMGLTGLKSGSQLPPNVYFIGPVFYVYMTDKVKDWKSRSRSPGTASCMDC